MASSATIPNPSPHPASSSPHLTPAFPLDLPVGHESLHLLAPARKGLHPPAGKNLPSHSLAASSHSYILAHPQR